MCGCQIMESNVNYFNTQVLAPMVRPNILSFRQECLKYGADLVWTEEIIDKRILNSVRVVNEKNGHIEYINLSDGSLVFSTIPEEKNFLIFQLGTADPVLALKAALHVMNDVAAIDINMGCPKSFSVNQGMGAALLSTPNLAADIVKTLTSNLPNRMQVSTKIRLLDDVPPYPKTCDFARLMVENGSSCITLHARLRNDRPRERARWSAYSMVCTAINKDRKVRIPLIANGDFFNQVDIKTVKSMNCNTELSSENESTPPDGFMIARGALANPSCFLRGIHTISKRQVVKSFLESCLKFNTPFQGAKFITQRMLCEDGSMMDMRKAVDSSKSMKDLCLSGGILKHEYDIWFVSSLPQACTLSFHKSLLLSNKIKWLELHKSQMVQIENFLSQEHIILFKNGEEFRYKFCNTITKFSEFPIKRETPSNDDETSNTEDISCV